MDQPSVSPHELYSHLGTGLAPVVLDVRSSADLAAANRIVVSASHRAADEIGRWQAALPRGRLVVAYCVHGHAVSQAVTTALRTAGVEAVYLDDGIAGWTEAGLPTRRNIGATPGKWVTRERPKIYRIACPTTITICSDVVLVRPWPNRQRRSMIGTMTPRRLSTPQT
jgi:rhodanese-related sulfurtransferase